MASLIARTPAEGMLPVEIGAAALSERTPCAITWVSPFAGQAAAVSAALEEAIGAAFPAPNTTTEGDGARAIWVGPDQALVFGPQVSPPHAAVADQSDGWAVFVLEGAAARDVLARLTPIDLRDARFRQGHTARTLLGHMTASLTRLGADSYEIVVFRSMARTAVHEISVAMKGVAGRG